MTGRRRPRRRRSGRKSLFFGVILIAAGLWWVVIDLLPNSSHTEPDWRGINQPIFVKGNLMDYSALGSGEDLKLPLPVLQEAVDSHIRYEKAAKTVIITTASSVVQMKLDNKEGKKNGKTVSFSEAPEQTDGVVYVPITPLKEAYGIAVHQDAETGAVILMNAGDQISLAKAQPDKSGETVALRESPTIKAPILMDMPEGERIRVWSQEQGWYFAQTDNGFAGYVKIDETELDGEKKIADVAVPSSRADTEWKGKPVNLVWEAVYSRRPDPKAIGKLPGINVVSPTWFSIVDGEGEVESKADPEYVTWAHGQNIEVWGLLSNSFDPDITTSVLATFDRRSRAINQMLQYAEKYKLDGINIDFENVYTKDKENLVQFMREMKPLAHAKGLIISIDVTPKSGSEMWSAFLDRRELAQAVDYMIVMSYDEHWASSPKAGSVSSLPWAEGTIQRIIEEDDVPSSKLILAVPLYTRIWTEEGENGGGKVSSKAVGMDKVRNLIHEEKLKPRLDEAAGQHYVEYKEGKTLKRIWIEDETSLKARVELAKSLKLGGLASWNRSLAVPEAWEVLNGIHK
ncbi:Predicted glycosyl hydrolase [Paenibacillus uliginis N3/975]|uniref:Predicted glycosyl hydrolase n=1 Tax=Paenibacillus uliginis N3/975 TaxID=1313296 RepID=A0A1X7GKS0_9BACL|nr:glycosyl hydrolase family 18 protein [Paenibacillus uliginis]SMF71306.1 Predicted glycosyl hydrolase [Paenibacillus uliginis N3/975]